MADPNSLQQDVLRMMRFLESAEDRSAIKDLIQSLQVAELDPQQLIWELTERRSGAPGGMAAGSRREASQFLSAVVAATASARALEHDDDVIGDDDDDDIDPAIAVLAKVSKSPGAALAALRRRQAQPTAAAASAQPASAAAAQQAHVATSPIPIGGRATGFMGLDDAVEGEDTEDRQQITRMFSKLERLSVPTLKLALQPWFQPADIEGQNAQQLRCRIVETVRYLAAMYLITVADKFHCLPDGDTNSSALINNLMLSLWQGISLLANKVRDHIALLLGVPVPASADEICIAVSGLGLGAFFCALNVPVLQQLCKELGVDYSMGPSVDMDTVTDVLSDRLSCHFYPSLVSRSTGGDTTSQGFCMVRTAVHENAPNSYTVTLDNACLLSMVGQRTYVSAPFKCAKANWRAKVTVSSEDSSLSLSVSHRSPEALFNVRMSVRSQSETKAKKQQQASTGANAGSSILEQQVAVNHVAAGMPVTVSRILNVRQLLKEGKGPRNVYSPVEDRLVFQLKLEVEPVAMPAGMHGKDAKTKSAVAAAAATAPQQQASAEAPKTGKAAKKEAAAAAAAAAANTAAVAAAAAAEAAAPPRGKTATPAASSDDHTDSALAALVAEEENERRSKALQKARQKLKERLKVVETTESTQRQSILTSSSAAFAVIAEEAKQAKQKIITKVKERERKHELSLAQPVAELQAQVSGLNQQVSTSRAALAKLSQEKAQLLKDSQKIQGQLAAKQRDIAGSEARISELTSSLADLDGQISDLERVVREAEESRHRQQRIQFLTAGIGGGHSAVTPLTATVDASTFWSTPNASPTRTASGGHGSGWLPY